MARYTRKYTVFNFIVDIVLSLLTGGLWLIWIFCREMRR
ncbi:membrane protein [Gordonia phage Avazak]|uniref:Membrane protein n=1 Tax=Gordonia phage Avazak TaxID=2656529 RepID=A0A649V6W3_9CAUD|nr:membrane protein [Gordonia phage Avazak]QGJ88056.1 membrane protein [Gordonia phage Avazak]